jgi:hypothetical protein
LNKEFRNSLVLSSFSNSKKEIDILILGTIYKYLSTNINKDNKSLQDNDYFFQLLANEYLSVEVS